MRRMIIHLNIIACCACYFSEKCWSKPIDLPEFFDLDKFTTEQVFDTLNLFNCEDFEALSVSGKEK